MPDHGVAPEFEPVDEAIRADADALSAELFNLRARLFPPSAAKPLRLFSSGEAAALIGISDAYLRQLSLAGFGPQAISVNGGRRSYSLQQINEYRGHLSREGRDYFPRRRAGDQLQVIAVTNFKGGSGKTTTSAHLAQYLALRGFFRVPRDRPGPSVEPFDLIRVSVKNRPRRERDPLCRNSL